jgi:hypothetical protein
MILDYVRYDAMHQTPVPELRCESGLENHCRSIDAVDDEEDVANVGSREHVGSSNGKKKWIGE